MKAKAERRLAITSASLSESRTFWETVLTNVTITAGPASIIPYDHEISLDPDDDVHFGIKKTLGIDISSKIKSISGGSSKNILSIFTTALSGLVQKYSDSQVIHLAMPVESKDLAFSPENNLLRFFVKINPDDTFRSLLLAVKNNISKTYLHQNFPSDILEHDISAGSAANWVQHFNIVISPAFLYSAIRTTASPPDLIFLFDTDKDPFEITIRCNKMRYGERQISLLLTYYELLLKNMIQYPDKLISGFSLASPEFEQKILNVINRTDKQVNGDQTILGLWNECVSKYPGKNAVFDEERTLTYSQADSNSAILAAKLQAQGVVPGDKVILFLSPSSKILVGILACMKCRAAFVPVDRETPPERFRKIINDCNNPVVITSGRTDIPSEVTKRIEIDGPVDADLFKYRPLAPLASDNAYIIYTSGSTGKPKGVIIGHGSLFNYVQWFIGKAKLNCNDSTILTSSFAFDLGYTSLFTAICAGGSIHILSKRNYLNTECLLPYIQKNKISFLKITPSFLSIILNDPVYNGSYFKSTRLIVSGGEAIIPAAVKSVFDSVDHGITILNHYGPTETTIGVLTNTITRETLDMFMRQPVIGLPIDNVECYILDKDLQLLPEGIKGELYIGGACLFNGYFNDDSATAEKLTRHPFRPGKYLYKTGDIASWSSDTTIKFWGRKDSQVKVHGYRIDLKDIEINMLNYPGMLQVSVMVGDISPGDKKIHAFFTATKKIEIDLLKKFLKERLPFYMLPSIVKQVTSFNLTGNGKVDLMKISDSVSATTTIDRPGEYATMKRIWSELLGAPADTLTYTSNFFSLGGHSLLVLELIAAIQQQFNKKISISDIYKYESLFSLSEYVSLAKNQTDREIIKVADKEYYECSPSQKRMYILQKLEPGSTAYNKPYALKLTGRPDLEKLKACLQMVLDRHETMRTTFMVKDNTIYQQIHENPMIKIGYLETTMQNLNVVIGNLIKPFRLDRLPLVRIYIIKISSNEHVLFIDTHHITSDAVSIKIILKELRGFYRNEQPELLKFRYRDYTEWLCTGLSQTKLHQQKEFWKNELSKIDKIKFPGLPYGASLSSKASAYGFKIDDILLRKLKLTAAEKKVTLFVLLLASFKVLLYKLSGAKDLVVGSSHEGRLHPDAKEIVGLFINTIVIRNEIKPGISFSGFVLQVQSKLISVFENQDYQFEQMVEDFQITTPAYEHPVFDIFFEMTMNLADHFDLPGISAEPCKPIPTHAKFDLAFYLEESKDHVDVTIEYKQALFDRIAINELAENYLSVLQMITVNPGIQIDQIQINWSALNSLNGQENLLRPEEHRQ